MSNIVSHWSETTVQTATSREVHMLPNRRINRKGADMTKFQFTRRQLIGSALAGTVVALATRSTAATGFSVGERQVIALSDGHFDMPSDMFLGTPEGLRAQLGNPTRIAANTYAHRAGERTFMFDAGAGTSDSITRAFPTASKLPDDLNAAGIAPSDVTDVVITHMHPDHVGGLAVNGQAAFPNARIHIAAAEWKFWNACDFATTGPEALRPMIAAVQSLSKTVESNVILHNGAADLGEGVSVIPAPGHTPGHTAIVLDGGSEQFIVVGDLTVHEDVHFANPDYGWALDVDGGLAVASRKALLDMIATDGLIMGAAHVSKPGLGRVNREGEGYRFVPL
ncbi:MBL fold metallo-hydrolase [Ruegeria arenilitoris]|uniref:MBL fold metallo-hydrolase n=1 Tax=Ruegeria arenilitoris TaxID=1173585 RepID=UPI00147E747E|nr:MBL fold metallo-hydrolase [Ruegeria arenilitoris]